MNGKYFSTIVLACALSGCGGNNNSTSGAGAGTRVVDEPCDTVNTCRSGLACYGGLCRVICLNDDGCNGRQSCEAGVCLNGNSCRAGFTGANCEECEEGYFGEHCHLCPNCGFGKCQNGKNGNGQCVCNDGFAGTDCNDCAPDRYGADCANQVTCRQGTASSGLKGNGLCVGECTDPSAYGKNCVICTRPGGVYDQATDTDCQYVDTRDGATDIYQLVDIDGHLWFGQNLRYISQKFEPISEPYDNSSKYGYLYYITGKEDICPAGWRLPYKEDFDHLLALNPDKNDATNIFLRSKEWGNAPDTLGFGAYPVGMIDLGSYLYSGEQAAFWSATSKSDGASDGDLDLNSFLNVSDSPDQVTTKYVSVTAMSVRCLKEYCPGHHTGWDCDRCQEGWTGPDCENKVICVHGEYDDSGKCVQDGCDVGWIGENCDVRITCANGQVISTGKCKENSCKATWEGENCDRGTFTDNRDRTIYKKTSINGVTWMAENLRYHDEFITCLPQNNTTHINSYGCFYTWMAVHTLESPICPSGWHLPSTKEFNYLLDYVNNDPRGTGNAFLALIAKDTWSFYKNAGDEIYGFSALPGGYIENSMISYWGEWSGFWAYDTVGTDYGQALVFEGNNEYTNSVSVKEDIPRSNVPWALNVRCIQDN